MPRKWGIGLLIAAAALVLISGPIRRFLEKNEHPSAAVSSAKVATVINVDGKVLLRHKGDVDFHPIAADEEITHFDQLRTERGGKVTVEFSDRSAIELGENTDLYFELWNTELADSPLYLKFFTGDFRIVSQGDSVLKIFILQNNQLFTLQNRPKEQTRQIVIRQTPSQLTKTTTTSTEDGEEVLEVVDAPEGAGEPETLLSNSYIDQTIASQKALFQKCQSNSIRNKKQSNGQVLTGLTILPTGQVSQAQILSTSFSDLDLPNCALDVLRRLRFKAFQGEAIIRSYPLQFE